MYEHNIEEILYLLPNIFLYNNIKNETWGCILCIYEVVYINYIMVIFHVRIVWVTWERTIFMWIINALFFVGRIANISFIYSGTDRFSWSRKFHNTQLTTRIIVLNVYLSRTFKTKFAFEDWNKWTLYSFIFSILNCFSLGIRGMHYISNKF